MTKRNRFFKTQNIKTQNNSENNFELPIFQNDDQEDDSHGHGHGQEEVSSSEEDEHSVQSRSFIENHGSLWEQELHNGSDSDSDAEPEAISFQSGKEKSLDYIKGVMKQIENEKLKAKEKRRKLNSKYLEQKRQKETEKKKLPEDFFDDFPEESLKIKKVKSLKDESKEKVHMATKKNKSQHFLNKTTEEDEELSLADTEDDLADDFGSDDFIAFDGESSAKEDSISVSTMKDSQRKACGSLKAALEFKESVNRRHQKESVHSLLSKKAKRRTYQRR